MDISEVIVLDDENPYKECSCKAGYNMLDSWVGSDGLTRLYQCRKCGHLHLWSLGIDF